MSYKPIEFSTDAIHSIVDGKKTTTIQVVPDRPWYVTAQFGYDYSEDGYIGYIYSYPIYGKNMIGEEVCSYFITPRYQKDDILWVKEIYDVTRNSFNTKEVRYYLDDTTKENDEYIIWHSASNMPKDYARLFLKVKDVWIEHLNLLTYGELISLGFDIDNRAVDDYNILDKERLKLKPYWNNSLKEHEFNKRSWENFQSVFVYEFEICDKPDDFLTEECIIDTTKDYTETYHDDREDKNYISYTCPICSYLKRQIVDTKTTKLGQEIKFPLVELDDKYPFVQVEISNKKFHICYDCYQNYFNRSSE